MTSRKNGGETGRSADGKFQPGNPGRPRGARNKASIAVEALLEGEAEALTRRAVELAMEGDTTALRLCLERLCPPRKDRPVVFDLPAIEQPEDATKAMTSLLAAVATGDVTPTEAQSVAGVIETWRRTVETEDLARRVAALEGGS